MNRSWTTRAACLTLLVGLAACGGGLEPREVETGAAPPTTATGADDDGRGGPATTIAPTPEGASPVQVLDASVERTSAIDTAHFEMVYLYDTSSSEAFPLQQMRATGELADGGQSLHLVMETVPASAGSLEETIVDGVAYIDLPGAGCQSLDLSEFLGAITAGGGGGTDPSAVLQQLRGIDGDITDLGPLDVRGEPTTHYAAEFTIRQSLDAAPEEQAAALEDLYAALPDEFLDAPQAVDVFIDADGLMRRMQVASPSATVSGVTIPSYTTILDYFDFGAPVTIEAPTDCTPASASSLGMSGDLPS